MADTAVTATQLAINVVPTVTLGDGTAIDATGTMVVTPKGRLEECLVLIVNTTNAQKVATVLYGDSSPADAAGQGSLTVTLGAGDSTPTFSLVQLESARFLQNDGTVHMTFAGSMTGYVNAFQLAKAG